MTGPRRRTAGQFKTQKEQEATDAKNRNPFSTDEAVGQRLGLARQLLEAGDTERALQFADPVLGGVNMESIDFLSYLREKNSTAADQRYAAMLANAAANPESDANTVSLLSSICLPRICTLPLAAREEPVRRKRRPESPS